LVIDRETYPRKKKGILTRREAGLVSVKKVREIQKKGTYRMRDLGGKEKKL